MKLLALHCNPRLVFCGGHFLTLPLHNNGTKIEMDNGQSYAPQLPVSKAFLVVVWLSYLQTRPSHISVILVLRVLRVHGLEIVLNAIFWNLRSYRPKPSRPKRSHPMILTNPPVSVIAP